MRFEKPISASTLARQLGVAPQTIHNWVRKGTIAAAQLVNRGKFLISADHANAIMDLVQKGQSPAKPEQK